MKKKELEKIRNDLDEHLSTINENTVEIQGIFDYLNEVENKIDKISRRMERLQLSQDKPLEKPTISPLTQIETKVFLALYTEETPLSYNEISARTQLTIELVQESICAIARKGIPLQRSFVNNQQFLKISPEFKEWQAKENVINLSLQSFM